MTPQSILIVDDDPKMCSSIAALLSDCDCDLDTCNDGESAIDKINTKRFDLILLDAVMPGMSGMEVMGYINGHYPDLPVIVVTGLTTVDTAVEFLRRGAFDYVRKPFKVDELLTRIQNGLNQSRLLNQKKELEEQFQQAQKMEALGTLSAGIAHDFNNLLMGIQGHISLMQMDGTPIPPDSEHFEKIERYIESATNLMSQLLSISRGGRNDTKPMDLNRLIEATGQMFSRTKKEMVMHEFLDENLWAVEGDKGQLEQVFLNLFINAWQAMPRGGEIRVETKNVTFTEKQTKKLKMRPGRYVQASVSDTGVGMDKATQERIFDPFFTTKRTGKGSGLGLASAYRTVKNHGGLIVVKSAQGVGSTFSVYLPASTLPVPDEDYLEDQIKFGSGTVLLVDDEEMIIDVGSELIRKLGYSVIAADSGRRAIEIYSERKDEIDLVILDIIMPEKSGKETYDGLKSINPSLKVLLSSGYSVNDQVNEILANGANDFIQKPFNLYNLSEKMWGVIQGS